MTDNELLLAIADIMEKKIKAEVQPLKDDIKTLDNNIKNVEQHIDRKSVV